MRGGGAGAAPGKSGKEYRGNFAGQRRQVLFYGAIFVKQVKIEEGGI